MHAGYFMFFMRSPCNVSKTNEPTKPTQTPPRHPLRVHKLIIPSIFFVLWIFLFLTYPWDISAIDLVIAEVTSFYIEHYTNVLLFIFQALLRYRMAVKQ